MKIFALRARAFIDISVREFGTDEQKAAWLAWSIAHPRVRNTHDDPDDDGTGPMSEMIRSLMIDTLHKRYDHLMKQTRSPLISRNEAVCLNNEASTGYAIACSISGSNPGWAIG